MTPFQKYLSYVYRVVVEKTTSKHNNQLIVAIQDGKYVLNAQNANYSFATLHKVFQKALNKINIQKKEIKSVLVLGCGAGSIPTIIYKEMSLTPKMDAIEIDEKVVELGNKYFGLNEFSNLKIVIDDALNFVKSTNNKYDLIVVDLFKGINVPETFLTQHFFEQLKSLMNDNGELLLNFVAYNHETKQQTKEIETTLNKTFQSKVVVFKLKNINRVFWVKSKQL